MKPEFTALTNTPVVRLTRIPRSQWPIIQNLFNDGQWPIVIQIWNQYKVSEPLCNSCPAGIQVVRKHIPVLLKRHQEELEYQQSLESESRGLKEQVIETPTGDENSEAIEIIDNDEPVENPKKKRKSRKKKADESESEETKD